LLNLGQRVEQLASLLINGRRLARVGRLSRAVDTQLLFDLSQQRALWRYTLSWLWFLPPLAASWIFNIEVRYSLFLAAGWIIFWALLSRLHPRRQFLHDALAGTRLVSFHQKPDKPV
jgi:hypothetical protein